MAHLSEADLWDPTNLAGATALTGTIGWPGDPQVEDLGTAENGGVTLVKFTSFRGSPPGQPVAEDGGANGRRFLVRLGGWPVWAIPPKGQQAVVLFPDGALHAPGMGVIVAMPGANPFKQFSPTAAKLEMVGYDLVIKAKSVTLISEDPETGKRRMVSVSPEGGAQIADETGSGFFADGGEAQVKAIDGDGNLRASVACTQDSLMLLDAKGNSGVKCKGGNVTVSGNQCAINCGAIGLGSKASPATPVVVGVSGMAGVGSSSVFGSP